MLQVLGQAEDGAPGGEEDSSEARAEADSESDSEEEQAEGADAARWASGDVPANHGKLLPPSIMKISVACTRW